MRHSVNTIILLLLLVFHAEASDQSNMSSPFVFVTDGDESGLINAITAADQHFRSTGEVTRISVQHTGNFFEFTMPIAGTKNALPDYIGSYEIFSGNSLTLRFSAIGPQSGSFRLLTIAENEMKLGDVSIVGFGVKEGNGGAILLKEGVR